MDAVAKEPALHQKGKGYMIQLARIERRTKDPKRKRKYLMRSRAPFFARKAKTSETSALIITMSRK